MIPNAIVKAVNANTGQQRAVISSADGTYKFALLPPGTYSVSFSASGFKTVEVSRPRCECDGDPCSGSKSGNPVEQTDAVTVKATTEEIETTSAALGGVLALDLR